MKNNNLIKWLKSLKKPIISWTAFWLTVLWVAYAATTITTVSSQTINSWDTIWQWWFQSVNDKLLNTYTKTEVDSKWYLTTHQDISWKADQSTTYTKTEVDWLLATLEAKLPEPDWRAQDPNCDIPDITIGSQTWAGCNSTLWTGIEFVKNHTNSCRNYAWSAWQSCSSGQTLSSAKDTGWSSSGVWNIWGKLYTWDNAQNACGTGYHLPTIDEWTTAMISLWCTDTVSSTTTWWQCAWLWFKNNGSLYTTLKIPLAGYCGNDGVMFYSRGLSTHLWSSSVSGTSGRGVHLYRDYDTVYRGYRSKAYGFSVRCLKD